MNGGLERVCGEWVGFEGFSRMNEDKGTLYFYLFFKYRFISFLFFPSTSLT